MDWKYFEKWGLSSEDFRVDVYKITILNECYKRGVKISVEPLEISVSCHSEKSQVKNKDKCLKMLDAILTNCVV